MIEIRELKPDNPNGEWMILIDKKTSIDYYTFAEAKEIKRRLNELIPEEI